MLKTLSNEQLTRELKIFWQSIPLEDRNQLADMLWEYFLGIRAERIINTLQTKY